MSTLRLDNETYLAYALSNYFSDSHINIEEFVKSIKQITYVNKLINKSNNINHRLILNHIIIISNTFGVFPTVRLLFFKIPKEKHSKVKTYLHYLNYITDDIIIPEVNVKEITLDNELLYLLESL